MATSPTPLKLSADGLSGAQTPGTKKLRATTPVEETTTSPRTSPQYLHVLKDGDLWFGDGNIVLVAGDQVFRVHGSLLARRCAVFADMLALSQPDTNNDVFEDLPAIMLMDDSAALSSFLRAIYDGRVPQLDTRSNFLILAALLRLATKYGAQDLRAKALDQLSLAWPSRLQIWKFSVSATANRPAIDNFLWPYAHLEEVVRLVFETNASFLLPCLLLEMCDAYWRSLSSIARTFILSLLPPIYLPRFVGFKDWLHDSAIVLAHWCLQRTSDSSCTIRSGKCSKELKSLAVGLLEDSLRADGAVFRSPFALTELAQKMVRTRNSICAVCRSAFTNAVTARREIIWQNLPIGLGLSEWEILRNQTRVPDSLDSGTVLPSGNVDIIIPNTCGQVHPPARFSTILKLYDISANQLERLGPKQEPARCHECSSCLMEKVSSSVTIFLRSTRSRSVRSEVNPNYSQLRSLWRMLQSFILKQNLRCSLGFHCLESCVVSLVGKFTSGLDATGTCEALLRIHASDPTLRRHFSTS